MDRWSTYNTHTLLLQPLEYFFIHTNRYHKLHTHRRTYAPMGRGFSRSSMNSARPSRRFSTPGGSVGHRSAVCVYMWIYVDTGE